MPPMDDETQAFLEELTRAAVAKRQAALAKLSAAAEACGGPPPGPEEPPLGGWQGASPSGSPAAASGPGLAGGAKPGQPEA